MLPLTKLIKADNIYSLKSTKRTLDDAKVLINIEGKSQLLPTNLTTLYNYIKEIKYMPSFQPSKKIPENLNFSSIYEHLKSIQNIQCIEAGNKIYYINSKIDPHLFIWRENIKCNTYYATYNAYSKDVEFQLNIKNYIEEMINMIHNNISLYIYFEGYYESILFKGGYYNINICDAAIISIDISAKIFETESIRPKIKEDDLEYIEEYKNDTKYDDIEERRLEHEHEVGDKEFYDKCHEEYLWEYEYEDDPDESDEEGNDDEINNEEEPEEPEEPKDSEDSIKSNQLASLNLPSFANNSTKSKIPNNQNEKTTFVNNSWASNSKDNNQNKPILQNAYSKSGKIIRNACYVFDGKSAAEKYAETIQRISDYVEQSEKEEAKYWDDMNKYKQQEQARKLKEQKKLKKVENAKTRAELCGKMRAAKAEYRKLEKELTKLG